MACGENPKRVYGSKGRMPSTRMGNFAVDRQTRLDAKKWIADGRKPRNLAMETLAGVLDGKILVQNHCYRSDEMAQVLDMAKEMGYKVTAFHHAVEAYKIADLLRENNICVAMWADWWGFKLEAYDGIRENIAFVDAAGACAMVHSDSEVGIQRLNQEAAKAMADGRRAGIDITRAQAWTWLSRNPARALHIDAETGTLEAGKRADVVIWSADPLTSYAVAQQVYMDGALVYERGAQRDPPSDFELGQTYRERAQ
jgi:imidazolonepropionase-like amidohydrolase